MKGKKENNIFANYLRKDPVTRSINKNIDKKKKVKKSIH